jgi:two-component system chemotaxis sensor kinase CheA
MPEPDESLIHEFLVEAYEALERLDADLVRLEKDPTARDTLDSAFRTLHTIKGNAGLLGYENLQTVAHAGETVLGCVRGGEIRFSVAIADAILSTVDAVRRILAHIEARRTDDAGDHSALIRRLQSLLVLADMPASPASSSPPTLASDAYGASDAKSAGDPDGPHAGAVDPRTPGVLDSRIRVDVGLLDKLMNLVGELVLARNQILQYTITQKNASFLATSQRLSLITTELQEGVMKTRMQPIANVWGRFPRVVRDLASACGKEVFIQMEGSETELDRTIIEAIKDPLTHIVRNAVAHGIESPQTRALAGKSLTGLLSLRSFHEGGQVNIEIADDGAGIDLEKVRHTALDRGLLTPEQAAHLTERESLALIYLPGFSTADTVSSLAGRGVGMDVVKTNIEKIGGTIDIHSKSGIGTTVRIKIPLTLAIIPALIVTAGGDRYAIPQVSLLELVRLDGEHLRRSIERFHGVPVYRLRGDLLPLVYLHHLLWGDGDMSVSDPSAGDALNIVVLQADDRQFGLVVEAISDTQEIVVKPLGKHLKGISIFAGATIMGDGAVALILDVPGIAQHASVISEMHDRSLVENDRSLRARGSGASHRLLVCEVEGNRRLAIPLSTVTRLEEFPRSAIETTGEGEVVQYRGEIMLLVSVAGMLGCGSYTLPAGDGTIPVVVYSTGARQIGFVVDRILDIVEGSVTVGSSGPHLGVVGSAVVQNRVTDVVDVAALLQAALPAHLLQPIASVEV